MFGEKGRLARHDFYVVLAVSACFVLALVAKSVVDFSHSGPQIADEIARSYLGYAAYALARLGAWAFAMTALMAAVGVFVYHCLATVFNWRHRWQFALGSAILAVGLITFTRFAHFLLYMPGGVMASFNYRASRLYPLWELLTPGRVAMLEWGVALLFAVPALLALMVLMRRREWRRSALVTGIAVPPMALLLGWNAVQEPSPAPLPAPSQGRPNILMIGSDTLRADRLGVNGNTRPLTPNIDGLAAKGTNFSQYIVPAGRTAPSLLSLLTGTWPHTHGVRDNFVGDQEAVLPHPALPRILGDAGYQTAVVGDWAGSDLGKFDLGFGHVDTSPDQWNLKYLLRQGPKDIRLFLSLFTHNRFGKHFLPEVYYLAGMPLTSEVGRDAREEIRSLAGQGSPFFLDVFIASTHGPFSAPYPYYRLYADPGYRGDSLFSMSSVSSVEEVLKAQEEGKQHFDVRQIFDLYDGAVKSFDDEVGRILAYLRESGLDKNTIVVIYSDHGTDLFEGGETWGQGNIVSDFSYRAPLVIYDPRRPPVGNVGRTVRAVDVAPTLLDLAKIPVPAFIEGKSLLPFLEHGNAEPDRVAFAETGIWIAKVRGLPRDRIAYPSVLELLETTDKKTGGLSIKPRYRETIIRAKSRLAREGRWALVYFPLEDGEQYALYDLQTDLAMRHDVMAQHPEVAARLKEKLREWMLREG
jgi:arylsulfatase A-like enzyme